MRRDLYLVTNNNNILRLRMRVALRSHASRSHAALRPCSTTGRPPPSSLFHASSSPRPLSLSSLFLLHSRLLRASTLHFSLFNKMLLQGIHRHFTSATIKKCVRRFATKAPTTNLYKQLIFLEQRIKYDATAKGT